MAQATKRRSLSFQDRAELFRRFKAGESLTAIAATMGRSAGCVYNVLGRYGGIAPRDRKRSKRALSALEREEISRAICARQSMRSIARSIGRDVSTVSREIGRNGGRSDYRAAHADKRAWARAHRPQTCKLQKNAELAAIVSTQLEQDWSPQQISCWLRTEYPGRTEMHVSHETIYLTLFVQARGALKKQLLAHLRRQKTMRQPRKKASRNEGVLADAISIRERPAEVEDRAVPGHWEGDLIAGKQNRSFIGTLVERHTRYVKLVKVESKDAVDMAAALAREVLRLPEELRRSLTWDRGTEMARHKDFTVATDVKVYFCDPHSPWQRGSNENTNGLLRQYFPKGTDLSGFTQAELDAVARKLNGRPRMTLNWRSPAQKLRDVVASTS